MINGHGGNIFDKARELGCDPMDILDMSSNVNPLGPLPGLMSVLREHLERIIALPEAGAESMIEAFSLHHGLNSRNVLAGNGTTQLIHTLPLALNIRRALILGPTYSDYADACNMHGVDYLYMLSDETTSFAHSLKDVGDIFCDTVFICNPNNPTGTLISAEAIESLCRRNPKVRFIIDESYLPFVPNGEARSMIHSPLPNVIVLNSMSKIFRIPGLRIGFVVAPKDIIARMGAYMLPWSVNTLAQAAVKYLMVRKQEVCDFIEKTRAYLAEERRFVTTALQSAPGLTLFPSTTSFILAKLDKLTAEEISHFLLGHRILIRNCSNFMGLSNKFIRISLKTHDENQMLIAGLLDCCENLN